MRKEAAVFGVAFLGTSWIIDLFEIPYTDEVWLFSGVIIAMVLYRVHHNRDETYLRFTTPLLLIVFGAYLTVKVPKVWFTFYHLRLAQLISLALYVFFGWLIVQRNSRERRADPIQFGEQG